jgi:hypothetical protein
VAPCESVNVQLSCLSLCGLHNFYLSYKETSIIEFELRDQAVSPPCTRRHRTNGYVPNDGVVSPMDAFLLNFVLVFAFSQAHQALEEGRPEARVRDLEDENVSLRESLRQAADAPKIKQRMASVQALEVENASLRKSLGETKAVCFLLCLICGVFAILLALLLWRMYGKAFLSMSYAEQNDALAIPTFVVVIVIQVGLRFSKTLRAMINSMVQALATFFEPAMEKTRSP